MEFFDWLRANVAVAQFFAYTALTITTAIVALLSLKFSFRQHYGWNPILLLVNRGLMGGAFTDSGERSDNKETSSGIFAWVTFDLWNRRTYPIVIEHVCISFSQDILERKYQGRSKGEDVWVLTRDGHELRERFVLDNGKHHSFSLAARMQTDQSLDDINCEVEIKVKYFDPRRKKRQKMVLKEPYNFR